VGSGRGFRYQGIFSKGFTQDTFPQPDDFPLLIYVDCHSLDTQQSGARRARANDFIRLGQNTLQLAAGRFIILTFFLDNKMQLI
jgi:hypothetical protein